MQPFQICISSSIRISRESWSLPHAGFFLDALTNEHTKNFGVSLLLTGRSNYPWCTWNHGSINNSRQCSVYTVQFTVYSIQHAMYTVQYTDSVYSLRQWERRTPKGNLKEISRNLIFIKFLHRIRQVPNQDFSTSLWIQSYARTCQDIMEVSSVRLIWGLNFIT